MMEVSLSSSLPMPSSDMAAAPVAASAASATQQYSVETEPMSHASSSSFCHQFSSSESRPSSMHGPMVTGKEAAARPELPPIVDMPMRDSQARTPTAYSGDKPSNQGLPPLCHSPPIPAFLEPAPQLDNHRIGQYELAFRPHLFASFKEKSFSSPEQQQQLSNNHYSHQQQHHHHRWSLPSKPTLQIPTARRSSQPLPYLQPRPADQEVRSGPEHNRSEDVEAQYSPMSPTMATASAAAAAAAVQHHPGSAVAEAFLKCLRYSGLRNNPSTPPPCSLSSSSSTNDSTSSSDDEALLEEQDEATRIAAEALAAASADAHHRAAQEEQQRNNNLVSLVMQNKRPSTSSGIDHSKFLTKNAHIKRPRNAWIHFRCHYGQALKSQDPTLRAEEISKRASRRWARLTEKEKKPWHDLAEQEKIAHKEAFPEYRYCPKRHSSASSLSSFSSSSLASPSSTAAGNNNALMFAADTDGDAQSAADGQLRGDTSGHRYKKARRRTK